MNDVLKQLNSGEIKLKKTVIIKNKNKGDELMNEMAIILRRRIGLLDGQ